MWHRFLPPESVESQGTFVLDVFFLDWPELMPEGKNPGHCQPDPQANQEEPAVNGKSNQDHNDDSQGNENSRTTFERKLAGSRLTRWFHKGLSAVSDTCPTHTGSRADLYSICTSQ
jgi:hypothetical protein